MLTALSVSLLLTLLFELGFALLCGLRSRRILLLVLLANCLTNPPAVLLHHTAAHLWGWPDLPVTAVLECAAILTEWRCFRACPDQLHRPFLFSLLANTFSYICGCIVNLFF